MKAKVQPYASTAHPAAVPLDGLSPAGATSVPPPSVPWLVPLLAHELLNDLSVTSALLQLLGASLGSHPVQRAAPVAAADRAPADEAYQPHLAWMWLRRLEAQVAGLQARARTWPLLLDEWAHLTPQPSQLRSVLEEVRDRLESEAVARSVQIHLSYAGPGGPDRSIETHPPLLVEALVCLVRNAVQFTPPGGEVRVRWVQLRKACHIWIDDQGPGVPSSFLARPFHPPTVQVSSRPGGHGWGLRLADQILSQLSGYLRFANRRPRGATAYVRLPAND